MTGKSKEFLPYREKPSWTESGFIDARLAEVLPLAHELKNLSFVGKCVSPTLYGQNIGEIPYSVKQHRYFTMKLGGNAEAFSLRPFIRDEGFFNTMKNIMGLNIIGEFKKLFMEKSQ